MDALRIPKKLGICPLVDALIEIRFKSDFDKSVIFGFIYGLVKDDYSGRVVNLPLSQIPAQIRDNDPNLQFKPLYRIEGKDTIVQIGTDVLCLSSKIPYIGWDILSVKAFSIIEKLYNSGVIKNVLRLGHRYVNFFPGNIDDNLNMSFSFVPQYAILNSNIRTEVKDNDFTSTLQYSNSAVYKPHPSASELQGCLIDIDTFKNYSDNYFASHFKEEICVAHASEKKLFYSLLKDDFIQNLHPEYE